MKLFHAKKPPEGRRGVFTMPLTFGKSFLMGHGEIETLMQVEIRQLEKAGNLIKVWYDKHTMTGLPPTAYPSTIAGMLPVWIPEEKIRWIDD